MLTSYRYIREEGFMEGGSRLGLTMKRSHTIVEEWPMGLKLRPEQIGAKEEFEILLASSHSRAERYVEWKWT
jgi:hypothetical protein